MQAFRKNHAAKREKEMCVRQISPEIGGYAQESRKSLFKTDIYNF